MSVKFDRRKADIMMSPPRPVDCTAGMESVPDTFKVTETFLQTYKTMRGPGDKEPSPLFHGGILRNELGEAVGLIADSDERQ
jgi:hypothetical protein